MRYTAIALAALVLLMSGCQDDELIAENGRLQTEVERLNNDLKDLQEVERDKQDQIDTLRQEVGDLKNDNILVKGQTLLSVCADPDKMCKGHKPEPEVPVQEFCEVPTSPEDVIVKIPDYTGRYVNEHHEYSADTYGGWAISAPPAGLPDAVFHDVSMWNEQPPLNSECRWEVSTRSWSRGECYPEGLLTEKGGWALTEELVEKCLPPIPVSWTYLLDQQMVSMVETARRAADDLGGEHAEYEKRMMAVYGILAAGELSSLPYQRELVAPFLDDVMPVIYKSQRLRESMFRWVMPHVKVTFGHMSVEARKAYIEIIDDAVKYLQRMNVAQEDAYLERLQKAGDDSGFTTVDPTGKGWTYRKVHAFIYRRAKQGVPKAVMLSYLRRARAQLAPLAK